jgi:CheY-like chemotaxis protein
VLTDIQMPGMDGCEATRRLRDDRRFEALSVLAVTAHGLAADRDRCRAFGMDDHIAKPYSFLDLARAMKRWLPIDPPLEAGRSDGRADALA